MHRRFALWMIVLLLAACGGAEAVPDPTASPLPPTSTPEAAPIAETAVPTEPVAEPSPEPTAVSSVPTNENGVELVARVNGEGITRPAFERALARIQQQNFVAADPAALEASVLDMLIEQKLIEQAAAEQQIAVTDAEVEAEYQANRQLVDSDDAWQRWLGENLYTEEEFRESLRATLIAGRVRDSITANLPANVPQVRARHILVGTLDEANAVLERLRNGEDFGALAAELSQDVTTREQGGDLGWFVDGELLEPALTAVAFAIDPGQIAGPVSTRLGYHVVQSLEKAERPLEAERQPILAQITFERWLDGREYNSIIERYQS